MTVTTSQSGSYSDSGSGIDLVGTLTGPGVFVAVLTLDGALSGGDSFDVFLRDSLDGGATNRRLWVVEGIDSGSDPAVAVISPPTPLRDTTWGALIVDKTVAVGPIVFQWVLYKVAELTP